MYICIIPDLPYNMIIPFQKEIPSGGSQAGHISQKHPVLTLD